MVTDNISAPKRKVGLGLTLGVAFIPFLFAWLLLRPGYSVFARIVGFLWFGFILVAVYHSGPSNTSSGNTASSTAQASALVSNAAAAPASAPNSTAGESKWQYSQDIDQMRGTKTLYASLTSEDEQTFDFPYAGGPAFLTIRQRPSDGLNFTLDIKGQFMCNQFSNNTVAVKFDKGPIQRYSCVEPSDGRTGEIFIEGGRRFLNQLKKGKELVIEAEFYQQGNHQMTFDVRGLKWD